jgi:hypothetical protein
MAAPEQINGSITTGGTAQVGIAADKTRRTICIQNTSDTDMWCNFLTTAAADVGFMVKAGGERVMRLADWPMIVKALSVIGATTGKKFNILTDTAN